MKPNKTNPLFARFFRGNTLITAVVLSLGASTLPKLAAQSISVNFGADRSGSAVTEAGKTTGAVPIAGNLWNNTAVNGSGTLGSLIDSTGAATSGTVTWTAPNTWESASAGATATSENGDLTKGYLDDGGAGWTVNLKSPYLLNDVYVIHATDQGNPATMSAVSVNGRFYVGNGAGGTIPVAGSAFSWSAANFSTADALVESTNFIKVPNQGGVSLAGLNSSPGRAAIAGVQVVNTYTGVLSYWDIDGATAGAGGATPAGTWNATNSNWSTSVAGDLATGTWTASQAAVFSAGTNSTGAYTVQVAGPVTADAVWAKDGTVTLADGGSGVINLAGSAILRGDTQLVVSAPVSAAALNTHGNVTLGSTANAITGLASISGTTTLATAQTFGSLAGAGTVALGTNALTVGGGNTDSEFFGLFTGSGAISKTGSGRLSLGNNITGYTGTLSANAGILRIGTGGNSGSLSGTLAVNGTVEVLRSDTNTQPTIFTGAGALNFLGTGVSGQSDYTIGGVTTGFTGAVSIDDSRLRVSPANLDNCASITVLNGGQAWLFAGNHSESYTLNGNGWLEPTGYLGAFRFETNANVTGSVNVASDSRMVAWGTTGTVSGALTGSAALSLNLDGNPGTLNFTGATVGYTGAMTLNAGTLNIGASGLGGSLTVAGGTATAVNNTVNRAGGTATLAGGIAGNLTVNGGTASADGATAVATAGGATVTVNGAIGGSVVVNAGTVTLSNGGTGTAAPGTAVLNSSVAGNVTVADGAILGGDGSVAGTLNLGATVGSTLRVNAATAGALSAGTVKLTGTNTVTLSNLPTAAGPFVVLGYTALASGDENNFDVPDGLFRGNPEVEHDLPNSRFILTLDSQSRTWNNAGLTGTWNTTDLNWAGGDNLFYSGDSVIFTDTAVGTVNLATGLQPLSITLQNTANNNYTFTGGSIIGSTGVTMTGGGNLTLGGANAFTGAINVGSGVLAMGSAQAFGLSSGITVADGATADINGQTPGTAATGGYTYTIKGTGVAGSGAIRNTGAGVASNAGVKSLVLTGNATINAVGRFDVGFANVAGTGTITGNGYTLTKIGAGGIAMRANASASPITMVAEAGDLWAENDDNALGGTTGSVTANGTARIGTYGDRTIATPVILNAGTSLMNLGGGTGIWTGTITAAGDVTVNAGGNMAIDGTLTGTGNITKTGGSVVALQSVASGYSGRITANAGTLRVENNAALGTATGPDVLKIGNATLQGGTITALASTTLGSPTVGITQTGNVTYDAGAGLTLTIDGAITGTGNLIKANNTGALVFTQGISLTGTSSSNGGTQTFNGNLALSGNFEVGTNIVSNLNCPTFTATSGMKFWTGTTNIAIGTGTVGDMEVGQATSQSHIINHTAGTLNVTTDLRVGHYPTETSTYNLSGGVINQPDTVTNPADEGQANLMLGIDGTGELIQSGGTINTTSLVLDARGDTAGTDIYRMTGGRLNMGKWGIRSGNAGATTLIELGGGTVGATADWSSILNMTLTGTNGDVIIDTVDPVNATPRSITLSGILAGTGGLIKTGAGTLSLAGAAGTFTGTAVVNGGTLLVNSGATATATLKTATGGTLRPGTLGATGTANAGNLTLDGGSADFRVGASTDKFVVATNLAVNSPTAIRAIPTNAISGPFPQTFEVIDYTGTVGGTAGFAGLSFGSSNPHLKGTLVNDTDNTIIKVQINEADTVVWKGNVNADWDVDTSSNWVLGSDGTTASKYYDFDVVKFDNGGLGTSTVNLVGTITPATLSVENTSGTYTFQGSGIGGGTGLTKMGAGGLTILTNNTFTGLVDIQGGRVDIGNGGANGVLGGTGNVSLATGGTLAFNTTTTAVLPATRVVSGGGAIEQNGTGTLEFQGYHTFSGGLTLNAGTVLLSSGGGEAGVIGGVVTVNGGTLSATTGNAFGWGGNRIYTLNVNGGTVTTSANGDQGWAIAMNLTGGTITSTGPGYYSLGGGSAVNYQGTTTPVTFSGAIRLREGNPNDQLPFTVADGAAPVDLTVSGSLSLGGGISKSGPGTMELSGANTFTGAIGVNEGTLRYTRPRHSVIPNALTGTGGTLEHNSPEELVLTGDGSAFAGTIDANGKVVRLAGATSGSGTGGTLALEGGSLNLGINTEGVLFYQSIGGSNAMNTTPLDTLVLSDSAALLHSVIPGTTTIAYDGEIYLPAGQWSFGENVDDAVYVTIGGQTIINDGTWNNPTSGTFTSPADGWYPITLRVQNGGGGAGPVDAWATAGIGIGIKTGGTSTNVADYTRFEIGALGTKCRAVKAPGANTMAGGITLGGGVPNKINTGVGSLAVNGVITGPAGSSLEKSGTGTLTLNGANTYAGDTVVKEGILAVNGTSIKDGNKLVIESGIVEVTGTESVGALYFGTTAQAEGTYGSSLSDAAVKNDARFSGTGMVKVEALTGFASWIGGFGLAVGDQDPTDDPDKDGLANLMEWVLGGNPSLSDAAGIMPVQTVSGGNLVLSFKRTDASEVDTTVKGQWSTTLANGTWTDIAPVLVSENAAAADDMTVSVPLTNAVDGKLFLRLSATK